MRASVVLVMWNGAPHCVGIFKDMDTANKAFIAAVEHFGKSTVMQEMDVR